jgi:Zn-dependent M28 family amino/carboxypeptidase
VSLIRTCLQLGVLGIATLSAARAQSADSANVLPEAASLRSIRAKDLRHHIQVLASDAFEGRAPGTRGEELSVGYLMDTFRQFGMAPGNPDGSYIQEVPLLGITSRPSLRLDVAGHAVELVHREDFVAGSSSPEARVEVAGSQLVFVGYGVVAPEFGWDDYKDVDVRGKTVLVLMNDPQVAGTGSRLDPAVFRGVIKSRYASNRHKREVAASRGAAAMIIVHEAAHAGWEFEVILADAGREHFYLREEAGTQLQAEAMMPVARVRQVLRGAGQDFDALRARATRRDFHPVALPLEATFHIDNTVRKVVSRNVVARIEGHDPSLKDDVIIYTAHWDHLGRDPALTGDQIYNGAIDNASGVAALLEIAQAWRQLPQPPARSVLFIATTAEEQGLLGARYYVSHPLYPLARTVADLNLDSIGFWAPTRDINVVGLGETNMDPILRGVAAQLHRSVSFDRAPQEGSNLRQDAHAFAVGGVPSLYIARGGESLNPISGGTGSLTERLGAGAAYDDYHEVSDTIKSNWNYEGAVDVTRFAYAVGLHLAQRDDFPNWLVGSEYRAKRDEVRAPP